jgi:RHS repeat-associated protein
LKSAAGRFSSASSRCSRGEAYTFDGFGNLTGKTPTAGSAPALSLSINTANNQPIGLGSFDANGNTQGNSNSPGVPAYVWDVENRLVTTQPAVNQPTTYTYDPWGKRVWKEVPGVPSTCEIYFYGVAGQKLETYSCLTNSSGFYSTLEGINIYFGGKLLQVKGVWVATDRLGSVRANSNGETFAYFPYGEERANPTTPDGREKFATYTRDGFGQDYAQQRYYNANMGAFWSPDPGGIKTANSSDPTSWNRYGYVSGDPVNHSDPAGMEQDLCGPDWETDPSLEGPCCDPGQGLLGTAPYPGCYVGGGGSGGGGGGGGGGSSAAAPVLGLFVVGDCYYPHGEGYVATYEVAVTYQLEQLVNGVWSQVTGPPALNALAGGKISESVSVTSHHAVNFWYRHFTTFNPTFGGIWCTSGNSACTPSDQNQLMSNGQFTDLLAGQAGWVFNANQSFFAGSSPGSALPIFGAAIGANGTTVLNNFYSGGLVEVNGTLSPTPCK